LPSAARTPLTFQESSFMRPLVRRFKCRLQLVLPSADLDRRTAWRNAGLHT